MLEPENYLSAIEYRRILYALYSKNTPQFGVRVVISTKSTSRSAASNSHKTKPASQENVAIDGMTAKFPHQRNYRHHHQASSAWARVDSEIT